MLKFTKMNGAGNDFVVFDNLDGRLELGAAQIARICDRHRGVGADGVLVVERPANGADFRMRYYNADGGEAEMCGNGARCFARFASRVTGRTGGVSFETPAGVIRAECAGDDVRMAMSEPHGLALDQKINAGGVEVIAHSINTGVPHAVVFVDDLGKGGCARSGSGVATPSAFRAEGDQREFCADHGSGRGGRAHLRARGRG